MLLFEVMPSLSKGAVVEGKEICSSNEFDRIATTMTYPNVYKDRGNIGTKKKLSPKTAILKSTGTGTVYGRRTIMSK